MNTFQIIVALDGALLSETELAAQSLTLLAQALSPRQQERLRIDVIYQSGGGLTAMQALAEYVKGNLHFHQREGGDWRPQKVFANSIWFIASRRSAKEWIKKASEYGCAALTQPRLLEATFGYLPFVLVADEEKHGKGAPAIAGTLESLFDDPWALRMLSKAARKFHQHYVPKRQNQLSMEVGRIPAGLGFW